MLASDHGGVKRTHQNLHLAMNKTFWPLS